MIQGLVLTPFSYPCTCLFFLSGQPADFNRILSGQPAEFNRIMKIEKDIFLNLVDDTRLIHEAYFYDRCTRKLKHCKRRRRRCRRTLYD